jgi:UDP-glucuronate decarboxylase
LSKRLIAEGYQVVGLDNLSTGHLKNLDSLIHHERFEFIDHDVQSPFDIKVDGIFNLACPASPVHYQKNPIDTMKTNILGAINVLELAKKYDIPVLQASTSEVYGDPEVSPQSEEYLGHVNMTGPRACYDEGKRAAETLFFDYKRLYDLDIKVVRIFNTYGPNLDPLDGRVVSNFIIQALNNEPITIYGDGSQTRSFCYVDDLVDGILLMMNSKEHGPINLGNPVEMTVKELAEKIIELTSSNSQLVFLDLPIDDPARRNPNIGKAKLRLHFNPRILIEDGLKLSIKYFQEGPR